MVTYDKIIEKAWRAYRREAIARNVRGPQLRNLRQAFLSGASLVYMTLQEAVNQKPYDQKLIMENIENEIQLFSEEIDKRYLPLPRGTSDEE